MAKIFKFPKNKSYKAERFSRRKLWVTSVVASAMILVLGTLSLQRMLSDGGEGRLARWMGNSSGSAWLALEQESWEGSRFKPGHHARMPSSELEALRFERSPSSDKLEDLRIGVLKGQYRILWATPLSGADKRRLGYRIRGAEKMSPDSSGVIIQNREDFLNQFKELFPADFSAVRLISSGRLNEVYLLENRAKPVGQVKFDFNTDSTLISVRFSEAP